MRGQVNSLHKTPNGAGSFSRAVKPDIFVEETDPNIDEVPFQVGNDAKTAFKPAL